MATFVRLSLTCAAILSVASCGSSTGPSTFARVRLANLEVTQLGLTHSLCGGAFAYMVQDELRFEVIGRPASDYVGATLQHVLDDGTETLMGTVTQCPESVTACTSPAAVCLAGSSASGGHIRAFTRVAWTPTRTWRTFLRSGNSNSNVIQADITRSDGLPFGNLAAIAFLDAQRSGVSSTAGSFSLQAYSPGIAGRRVTLTYEVWSNGVRLSANTSSFVETRVEVRGPSGGILISSDPSELVGLLEERDAMGNVIATDRKTALFR
jgi:hypothetical protein